MSGLCRRLFLNQSDDSFTTMPSLLTLPSILLLVVTSGTTWAFSTNKGIKGGRDPFNRLFISQYPGSSLERRLHESSVLEEDQVDLSAEFQEFLDKKKFRSFLQKAALFDGAPPAKIEQLILECSEPVYYNEGDYVWKKGDDHKYIYFVRSGNFQFEEPSNRVFEGGQYFGALALINDEKKLYGAKAVGDGPHSLFQIETDVYKQIFPEMNKKKATEAVLKGTGQTAAYVSRSLEWTRIKNVLKSKSLFNETSDETLFQAANNVNSLQFEAGQTVFRQGDNSHSLYIVKSGVFEVVDEMNHNKTIGTVSEDELFGEFGAILDMARKFTIRASSDSCEVWELPVNAIDDLFEDELPVARVIALLQEKYGQKSKWSILTRAIRDDREELWALLKAASQPKKKKVSKHSTISTFAVGSAILALIPHWKPKLLKQFLCLQVDDPTHLTQLCVSNLLLIVVMLMGQLRFPAKTLRSRRILFNTLSTGMLFNLFTGFSNLMGPGSPSLIDAWSWPGRILIGGTCIGSVLGTALLYHDVLVGPKKGRDANPFYESRAIGLFSTTVYNLSNYLQYFHVFPMFDSRANYEMITFPLIVACGASSGVLILAKFLINLHLSMGALWATFQYEKRMTRRTSNILLGSTAILCLSDLYKWIYHFLKRVGQSPFKDASSYAASIDKKFCLTYIWWVPIIVSILHGVVSAIRQKGYEEAPSMT